MKKILKVLLLSILLIPSMALAKEDITIYLFRGSTCEHCEAALTYIHNHESEIPEGVNFVTYEVWENANNEKLKDKLEEKLNISEDDKGGVPFFIIGEKYMIGYSDATNFKELIEMAEEALKDDDYHDIVAETIKENNIKTKSLTLEDLYSEPNETVTIVVCTIFGIIVIGFILMIIFSGRKTKKTNKK